MHSRARASVDGKAGRLRPRTPDSKKRAPALGWLPRSLKQVTGRRNAPLGPAHIRVVGVELDRDGQTYIRRKLGMKLGKFAASIARVTIHVEDVNGPRGGVDQVCRIKVALIGLPSVVFQAQEALLQSAIDGALVGVERAVRRSVQRRRMKPVRSRGPIKSSRPVDPGSPA